jgi:hypothetical protein
MRTENICDSGTWTWSPAGPSDFPPERKMRAIVAVAPGWELVVCTAAKGKKASLAEARAHHRLGHRARGLG